MTVDAGTTLEGRLRELAEQVRGADAAVAEGRPEGVHDLRVALRRVRSLLRTFEPLLSREVAPTGLRLAAHCRWAGATLGPARDAEVVDELLAGVDALPDVLRSRVAARAEDDAVTALRTVGALRGDRRYGDLLDDLDGITHRDAFGDAGVPATLRCVRRSWRRLERRAEAADAEPAGSLHAEAALHETRKAAKRARYAVEAAAPLLDAAGRASAGLAEEVQEALGRHRDAQLAAALLHDLAAGLGDAVALEEADAAVHALEGRAGEAVAAYDALRPRLRSPAFLAPSGAPTEAP